MKREVDIYRGRWYMRMKFRMRESKGRENIQ